MTGTHDITACADIIYRKHFSFHRLASFLLKMVPIPGRALLENCVCYRDSDFTIV